MTNLLIIAYCGLEDGFLYASKGLEKLGYKIHFCPYLCYIMDNVENKDQLVIDQIKENNIEICLWWTNNVEVSSYEFIIKQSMLYTNLKPNLNPNLKHYFYNWDAFLYNYKVYNANLIWEERIEKKEKIYSLMNHIFSCNEKEISYFKDNYPNISISYACTGFDKDISYFEYDPIYECDVSIVLTNLYKNTNEFPTESTNITRYEIVEKLYQNRDKIKFHIYGFENLKELYPDCYKGFIRYSDCRKVFANSKINLSIHPMVYELNGPYSKEEYFSERVPQILGSKGLLLTNSYLSHYLKHGEDYIYIDKYCNWFNIIMDIIHNSSKYDNIRQNGYEKGLLYYQWNSWAEKLNKIFKKNI
jgi:hypothetical protein